MSLSNRAETLTCKLSTRTSGMKIGLHQSGDGVDSKARQAQQKQPESGPIQSGPDIRVLIYFHAYHDCRIKSVRSTVGEHQVAIPSNRRMKPMATAVNVGTKMLNDGQHWQALNEISYSKAFELRVQ